MSKIGSMVFDLQEQENAEFEFFGQHFAPPAKTALVLAHERLESACTAHKRQFPRRKSFSGMSAKPVMAELNIWN